MPPITSIARWCIGSFKIMTGRAEGLDELDLSEQGFWASFWAFPLTLPMELMRFAGHRSNEETSNSIGQSLLFDVVYSAVLWIAPLLVIGVLARTLGISDRFTTYVTASNWGTLTFAFLIFPISMAQIIFPTSALNDVLLVLAFFVSLGFGFMLTHITLQRPALFSMGVFILSFLVTITIALSVNNYLSS